jgi:hypothetical protein
MFALALGAHWYNRKGGVERQALGGIDTNVDKGASSPSAGDPKAL